MKKYFFSIIIITSSICEIKSQDFLIIGDTANMKILNYDTLITGSQKVWRTSLPIETKIGRIELVNYHDGWPSATHPRDFSTFYTINAYYAIETKHDTFALILPRWDSISNKDGWDTLAYQSEAYTVPKVFKLGDTLKLHESYTNEEYYLYYHKYYAIFWTYTDVERLDWIKNDTDKYIGLRFIYDNKNYFGWLCIDVLNWNATRIRQLAIPKDLVPDSSVTSINYMDNKIYKLFPNPVTDRLNITLPCNTKAIISIYNTVNTCLFQSTLKSYVTSINFSNFSPGIYLLVIFQNNQLYKFKILKY